jgi:anti-anti-sigma factor
MRPEKQLTVRAEVSGDTCTVTASGDLDLATVGAFHDAVAAACEDGAREVLLDLGDLRFMDSTGLHAILLLRNRVLVSVSHASASVRALFEMAGVPLEHDRDASEPRTEAA